MQKGHGIFAVFVNTNQGFWRILVIDVAHKATRNFSFQNVVGGTTSTTRKSHPRLSISSVLTCNKSKLKANHAALEKSLFFLERKTNIPLPNNYSAKCCAHLPRSADAHEA